jgi:hypothetical protein
MDAIRETIVDRDDIAPSALEFLYNIISFVLSLPERSTNIPPILVTAISRIIGSMTFLLTGGYLGLTSQPVNEIADDPFVKLFIPSLEFLFIVLCADRGGESLQVAAKSIHQVLLSALVDFYLLLRLCCSMA